MTENEKKIRVAIFDVDGTLLNSMPMWNRITYDYAVYKQIPVPDDLSKTLNRLCLEECAAYYKYQLGVKGTEAEILEEIIEMSRAQYRTSVPEIPGAAAFLRTLRAHGIHVAIATASDLSSLFPALERLGMRPYIEAAESCTTIGKSKAHPDIYLQCAAQFGATPEECVVFEDALHAMHTANHAGFTVVGVEAPLLSPDEQQQVAALCSRCIPDYHRLLNEILPIEAENHIGEDT